jgi:hypothetical protein
MKLLEAEPALAPGERADVPPPDAPAPGGRADVPEAPSRACTACGALLEPEQDWCLACGTAAPGRLGERPGWRTALAVAMLTTLLVAGAVAAAYAAMTDDAAREASAPAVADIAPQQTPAPATPAAEPPPVQATVEDDLPQVDSGSSSGSGAPAAEPLPDTTSSAPPADDGPTIEDDTAPADDTPAADPGPQRIEVAEDAGDLYDPLGRARNDGDPAKALDGDPGTNWAFSSSDPAQPGVGYVVRLDKAQGIKEVRLRTSTPGFKVEIYATDEAQPPDTITDTRWAHIRDRADVEAQQRIVLGEGTSRYRTLLVWFTEPPADGERIGLSELRLFG